MAHIPLVPCPSEDASLTIGNIVLFNNGNQYIIKAIKKKTEVGKIAKELEKVLKGAQCCMGKYSCAQCPYDDEKNQCYDILRDDIDRMLDKIKEAKK